MSFHGETVLDIDMFGDCKKGEEFFEKLHDWIYTPCDNSCDIGCFKNIIRNAGLYGDYCHGVIDGVYTEDDDDDEHLRISIFCRHYNPSMLQLWLDVIEKHLPNFSFDRNAKRFVSVQYRTASADAAKFCTNDPAYIDHLYCDGDDEAIEEDVREYLRGAFDEAWGNGISDHNALDALLKGDITELIRYAHENLPYPPMVGRFEEVDVSEVDKYMNGE